MSEFTSNYQKKKWRDILYFAPMIIW